MSVSYGHYLELKRQARVIRRFDRVPLRSAQDDLARRQGYVNWGALVRLVSVPVQRGLRR